ncbi:phosphotransferase family protein [Streptomyces yaizuensis]|uniref:Uncharacterized protein n=1 Tax=Streptomyces yaizuensis TaxID=2989713 RepID=A0ABQ5PB51_9ACTN|nr:hypothetical protein [Streptomyces sp. YSPA8]GLF99456.1 hypothetical protein SYYSPA8_34185 [Streptomyces sp. YSPA8]
MASRLLLDDGRTAFLKGMSGDHPFAPQYADEITVTSALPDGVGPRVLWWATPDDSAGWWWLCLEDIPGTVPVLSPQAADTVKALAAVEQAGRLLLRDIGTAHRSPDRDPGRGTGPVDRRPEERLTGDGLGRAAHLGIVQQAIRDKLLDKLPAQGPGGDGGGHAVVPFWRVSASAVVMALIVGWSTKRPLTEAVRVA